MSRKKISISANFSIEPIERYVRSTLNKLGTAGDVEFAPYNQIAQQLLDKSSLFYANTTGVNVIYLRIEDLLGKRITGRGFEQDEIENLTLQAAELSTWIQNGQNFRVPTFVILCPHSTEIQRDESISSELRTVENHFTSTVENIPNVYVLSLEHIPERYSIYDYDNPRANDLGHVPYTEEFYSALGVELVRSVDTYFRKPYKVIVLDCDNTLWDGVCGEDGTFGIEFSQSRLFLQRFVVEQSKSGALLCLCSKNNEGDVWDVFEKRDEMILSREHLVASRVNWNQKSTNLEQLADELQLGLDSFIFIDDDPAVCAEVRARCPEVFTVELPANPTYIPGIIENLWVFDRLKITNEDRERTHLYQKQVERNKLQAESPDLASYLESLKLECEISLANLDDVARVSQLTLRTNQFNSTTLRYSEAEIQTLMNKEHTIVQTLRVRDRFGDYGLVGVVIYELHDDSINVDSFMLSCRVLGRGVEYRLMRELGDIATKKGLSAINLRFRQTAKNVPFLNFISEIAKSYVESNEEDRVYCVPSVIASKTFPNQTAMPAKVVSGNETEPIRTVKDGQFVSDQGAYLDLAYVLTKARTIQRDETSISVDRSLLRIDFLAPRTRTQYRLVGIWEKLLQLKNVGIQDDFFKLGGDSLVAVSLFVEMENEFGRVLPLSTLVTFPTIEKLAQIIDENVSETTWKYLVPLQTEGAKVPLFCMHAAGGNVLFYRDLANELGLSQPLLGLQARGVADRSETAHNRIEEMAKEYLREIREYQPAGPYQLCGSSFGGLVAYEAAVQLQAAGQAVSMLALFDTYAPGYPVQRPNKYPFQKNIVQISDWIRNAKRQTSEIDGLRERLLFAASKTKKLLSRYERKVLWKKNQFAVQYSQIIGGELPVDIQRNHKAIEDAEASYQPGGYKGKIILIRADQQPRNAVFDEYLGWGKFTNHRIVTEDVMGTHGALTVYPFATQLAEKLAPYLV